MTSTQVTMGSRLGAFIGTISLVGLRVCNGAPTGSPFPANSNQLQLPTGVRAEPGLFPRPNLDVLMGNTLPGGTGFESKIS